LEACDDEGGDTLAETMISPQPPPPTNLRQVLQPRLKLDLKKSYEYKPKR
jgi:hypothetical protein